MEYLSWKKWEAEAIGCNGTTTYSSGFDAIAIRQGKIIHLQEENLGLLVKLV